MSYFIDTALIVTQGLKLTMNQGLIRWGQMVTMAIGSGPGPELASFANHDMIEGQIRCLIAATPLSGRIEGIIVPVERFLGVLTPIISSLSPFPYL